MINRQTDEIDTRIDTERILAALTPQQRMAVDLYTRGYSYSDIARIFGLHRSTISRVFDQIRNKLA